MATRSLVRAAAAEVAAESPKELVRALGKLAEERSIRRGWVQDVDRIRAEISQPRLRLPSSMSALIRMRRWSMSTSTASRC